MITVFTATHNRAKRIKQLYESLLVQTCFDFEWVVVDDGSTDDTEKFFEEIRAKKNNFRVVYSKQKHGGKHRTINKGLDLANGEYFFMVDSDDVLLPDAIELIERWVSTIAGNKSFAGVSGLLLYRGEKRQDAQEEKYVDATNFEREKYGLLGDKAEVYRTDLLRKHKFPEFDGELFVTEDICYQEIANEGYKIRWFNEPVCVYEYLDDGLTKNGANDIKGHVENFEGFCYWAKRALKVKPFYNRHSVIKAYEEACRTKKINFSKRARILERSLCSYLVLVYLESWFSLGWHAVLKIVWAIRRKFVSTL